MRAVLPATTVKADSGLPHPRRLTVICSACRMFSSNGCDGRSPDFYGCGGRTFGLNGSDGRSSDFYGCGGRICDLCSCEGRIFRSVLLPLSHFLSV